MKRQLKPKRTKLNTIVPQRIKELERMYLNAAKRYLDQCASPIRKTQLGHMVFHNGVCVSDYTIKQD